MAGSVAANAGTHERYIEGREYLRQESRRGRRHADERLTPERTVLIVIDMVPFFALENRYCEFGPQPLPSEMCEPPTRSSS